MTVSPNVSTVTSVVALGLSNHNNNHNHNTTNGVVIVQQQQQEEEEGVSGGVETEYYDDTQLSNDLQQFLSNPSLRNGLMDGSLDIKSYSDTIAHEIQVLETQCIALYRNHTTEIMTLQKDLYQSSTILKALYEMLLGFQYDIGNLSHDIRNLQIQSTTLDVQLQNRKRVAQHLQSFLQHIIIAPTIIDIIQKGPVNCTQYIQAVHEIQQLYTNCSSSLSSTQQEKGYIPDWSCNVPIQETYCITQEMIQQIHILRNIAVQRIRSYFMEQLQQIIHSPSTNIRLLQVHSLLKYDALYDYLEDDYYDAIQQQQPDSSSTSNIPNIANEIYSIYIEIMSTTIQQLFRTYSQQLLLLDNTKYNCTRNDVLAIDDVLLRESVQNYKKMASSYNTTTSGSSNSNNSNSSNSSTTVAATTADSGTRKKVFLRVDPFSLNTRAMDVLGNHSTTTTSSSTGSNTTMSTTTTMTQTPTTSKSNTTTMMKSTSSTIPSGSKTPTVSSTKTNSSNPSQQQQQQKVGPTTVVVLPPRINVHISILQKEQYPYERLYGSIIGHLLDTVTNEHIFCRQFFKKSSGSNNANNDTFTLLFGNTISLLLEHIENYLFTCYDIICLLLMIQITHSVRSVARQRKIYTLEPFLDQILHLVWPRIKLIMDNHTRSIQQATATSLAVTDLHPHYISRRFGEFCCSILLIIHHNKNSNNNNNNNTLATTLDDATSITVPKSRTVARGTSDKANKFSDPEAHHHSAGSRLLQDLSTMMDAYIQLLDRVSEIHTTQKKRIVFLINNLDHVVCIFQERRVTGKECNKLVERLLQLREDFVEEELLSGFSKMIAFIQQTEAHMASIVTKSSNNNADTVRYDVNASVVESLVLDFAANWKSNIDQINRNVLTYFSNFRNGMEILKHCLTQLLLYYTRFQDIIRKVWKKSPPQFTKDLISTNAILAEIKKYALAI